MQMSSWPVNVQLLPLNFYLLLCAEQIGCCLLCVQAQQLSREVEQVTGEKARAEQQVGELRAVQGQLELEVARLQHQLQGLEGQLQVLTTLQGQRGLLHVQMMCSCYLSGHSIKLCLSCSSVWCILGIALWIAYEVDEPVCSHTRVL